MTAEQLATYSSADGPRRLRISRKWNDDGYLKG